MLDCGVLPPGRVSPRQASHFFLLAQKEVTKKESLTFMYAGACKGIRHGVFTCWRH